MSDQYTHLQFKSYVFRRAFSIKHQELLYRMRTSNRNGKIIMEKYIHTAKIDLQNLKDLAVQQQSLHSSILNLMVFVPKSLSNISDLQFATQRYFPNAQNIQVIFKADNAVDDFEHTPQDKQIFLSQNFEIKNMQIVGKFGIDNIQIDGNYKVSIENSFITKLRLQICNAPRVQITKCKFLTASLCCEFGGAVEINGLVALNVVMCPCYLFICHGKVVIKDIRIQNNPTDPKTFPAIWLNTIQDFLIQRARVQDWGAGVRIQNCKGEVKDMISRGCRFPLHLFEQSEVKFELLFIENYEVVSQILIEQGSMLKDFKNEISFFAPFYVT
eukprot:TRINITY_DN4202_c0_g1_i1.p1 TRINITY_DN4202_c0_g1~~TRINITY_DN4202_c0_g1_i1.p1  ORF type:complete len:328 (-),score=15.86 TRINITY_DN4202_c0_g1_i1:1267-2250(-)